MVLCIIALVVFGVLGIFSARYRGLAREAFACVFRMITLRPCESALDERIKARLLSHALNFSPRLARAINKHFKALSWAFTLLFFASLAYSAVSVYNYAAYGNCNGPNSNLVCALDELLKPGAQHQFFAPLTGKGPQLGSGETTLIEFGCFTCPYTKEAQPALKEFLAKHPEVRLEFRAFPIEKHALSREAAEAAFCAEEQGEAKFWEYHDLLFAHEGELSEANFGEWARQIGLDEAKFTQCYDSKKFAAKVERDVSDGKMAGVYGTPTFFIGNSVIVGPKTLEEFENALRNKDAVTPGQFGSCST